MLREFVDIQFLIQRIKNEFEKNSLGIPRSQMPQINNSNDFERFLHSQEIDVFSESIPVHRIKFAQDEFNYTKVLSMVDKKSSMQLENPPIWLSKDYYVIDGNHRVVALFLIAPHNIIKAKVVNLPIRPALEVAKKYSKVGYEGIGDFHT